MMKSTTMIKKCIILIMIFTLISGGTIFAEENSGDHALKVNFPDVPEGNWAQKHVSKLALLGISEGSPSGNFNPSLLVSQQDVIKMAVSLMGDTEGDTNIEATQSNHVVQFLNDYVDSYARPFVSLAFSKGLLDFNAESGNVKNGKWGKNSATREWVAKVVIHSIGKEALAQELSNVSSQFTDDLEISAWALGYINASVELNIVSGFGDGEFKPKGFVTRDQIAAFLSRGENYLSERSDRARTGTLTALTQSQITIMNENGQSESFVLHQDQKFYSAKKPNDAISRTDVRLYTKVYLIAHNGTAYYVEVTNDEPQLESTNGVLIAKSLDNFNDQTITILKDGKYNTYSLDSSVVVLNKDGSGSSLGNLIDNSTLTITFDTLIGNPVNQNSKVKQITVQSVPVNKSASGIVETIDSTDGKVTFMNEVTGDADTFTLADQPLVTYGDKILSVSELNMGDKVDYKIENSLITTIQLTKPTVPFMDTDQGVIADYSLDRNILTIVGVNDDLVSRRFADKVEVILSGSNAATLKDLQLDDEVKLQINSSNQVTKVEVLNREIKKLNQIDVFAYDPETMSLVVTMDKKLESFVLNEDTVIEYASGKWDIDSFDANLIFVKGKKVDMIFSNEKLMEVKLSSYYDGTIKELNTSNRTITIETNNREQTFALPLNTSVVIYNKTSTTISDLSIGNSVRLNLNASQSQINKIELMQTFLFRTIDTDQSKRQVTVNDQEGEKINLLIYSHIPMKHHAKSIPSFSDIKVDEPLIVEFYGNTIVSLEIPKATIGKLQAIHDSIQKLTIRDYDSETQETVWINTPKVYNAANSTIALNTLKTDDRIEIIVDGNGQVTIQLLEVKERLYWKYDATTNIVSFRPKTAGEQTDFTLAAEAYISENGNPISIESLKFIDKTTFYLLNGIVIEIKKN